MLMALTWYSLVDHVLSDAAFIDDPVWTRMDAVVLCWVTNTIIVDLQEVVRECGHLARHLWLTLENQFLGNRETGTLHLDATFHNFVQGDLSVTEYCRKFKGMADALADLGSPVDDRILVLNILHGLNQCFEHLGAIIRRSSPFPNFLKVWDDLLEEIHLDTAEPSAAPTALDTSTAPPAPKPQPFAPSRPPNNNNNRNKNNNHHNGGNGGKNSNNDCGCGGNSSNTTTASTGSTSNDGRATSSWPTYVNPWQGHIAIYLSPVLTG
jgi:hypothetical protein